MLYVVTGPPVTASITEVVIMTFRVARAVQTCGGRPSQWDAWTDQGQYLYLRFRHGVGSVTPYPSEDYEAWDPDVRPAIEWDDETAEGDISLEDFLAKAGMDLAPDAVVVG